MQISVFFFWLPETPLHPCCYANLDFCPSTPTVLAHFQIRRHPFPRIPLLYTVVHDPSPAPRAALSLRCDTPRSLH